MRLCRLTVLVSLAVLLFGIACRALTGLAYGLLGLPHGTYGHMKTFSLCVIVVSASVLLTSLVAAIALRFSPVIGAGASSGN